jgi:DNA-binding transcriptional regulator YdaS (Cro superfamily)
MTLREYLENTGQIQSDFAGILGVTQGVVSHWLTGRNRIPAETVIQIYKVTGGKVKPYDMRPDIYPDPDWSPVIVKSTKK